MVEPDQQKRRMNMEAAQEMRQMKTLARGGRRPLQYFSSDQRKRQTRLSPYLPLHCPLLILVQLLSIVDPVHTLQKHLPSYNREGLL